MLSTFPKQRTIFFGILVIVAIVTGVFVYTKWKTPLIPSKVACTQEAKLCPDGSAVGRTGPDCAFAPCPTTTLLKPETNGSCSGPRDTSCGMGYVCIQGCGPPVVRIDSPPAPYYCERADLAKKPRMCPICLASNTTISTPNGVVNVQDITVGMSVWSKNSRGEKVASKVIFIARTPVPKTHRVVHLDLSDGREVWVSPNHPTLNGSPVGLLHAGDAYDGATVRSADLVPYWDRATFDLLPDSDTHLYWANNIPLQSTLSFIH